MDGSAPKRLLRAPKNTPPAICRWHARVPLRSLRLRSLRHPGGISAPSECFSFCRVRVRSEAFFRETTRPQASALACRMQSAIRMHEKAWELRDRSARFSRAVTRTCAGLPDNAAVRKLSLQVSKAATAVDVGYRAACVSQTPDQFIAHISAAARHAKRARVLLLRMVELDHLTIEVARQLILEARVLEAILTASRNTARRRKRERAARPTAAGPDGRFA
jgi:four helix bundle protein